MLIVGFAVLAYCAFALYFIVGLGLNERAMERCISRQSGWSGAVQGPQMTATGPVWACTDGDGSEALSISFWQLGPEDALIPVVLLLGAFVALPVLVARSARRPGATSA